MWKPKYIDQKIKAYKIRNHFEEVGNVKKVAEKFGLSEGTIYRYLKYTDTRLPKRQRDEKGRFKA
jgi:predicted DNA-binding transcriptional regulator AlpA